MSPTSPTPSARIEGWELLDLLTSLVQKSLVVYEEDEQGHGRYRLLETVRQYARDRLVETREAEGMHRRQRDWFLGLAEQAEAGLRGAEQAIWLARLEVEHDNLRAALAWCQADEGDADAGLRLAAAMEWFWTRRGHFREGRHWLEGMLARGSGASAPVRARTLCRAVFLLCFQGDTPAAAALAEEAVALSREVGDKWLIAKSLHGSFNVAMARAEGETMRAHCQEGLALAQEEGDKWLIALWLGNWAFYHHHIQGDDRQAMSFYEQTLPLFREVGDNWSTGVTLMSCSGIARHQGDYEQAKAHVKEALALFVELRAGLWIAWSLGALAEVARAQGQPRRAARLSGAAEALREAAGVLGRPSGREDTCEEALATAWAEGHALPLARVIAEALEEEADG